MFYNINFIGILDNENNSYISGLINSFRDLNLSNTKPYYEIFDLLINKVKDYFKNISDVDDYIYKLIQLDNIFNTKINELSLLDILFFGVELFNYQLTVNKNYKSYINGVLDLLAFIFEKLNNLIKYVNANELLSNEHPFYFNRQN